MKRLILALVASCCASAATAPLTLARNGQTSYRIVMEKEASASEKRAVAELKTFLNEMTGARFPVVVDDSEPRGKFILVGRSRITDGLNLDMPGQTRKR
ncbi:MAG: hypothetical protein NTY38_11100 [Acidobacteria bacterium]|nr:hypothetical protein [Acidobacteriota bacterium]